VLGATGKTGGALVAQAVARGHSVTTFGRSPFAVDAHGTVHPVVGDPMRDAALSAALPGHDAVLSALGSRGLGATSVLADSSRATIAAMNTVGIRRLVILSSALLDANIGLMPRFAALTLLRHHSSDQRAMERLVAASNLDWTVLRPPRMTDSAPAGASEVLAAEPPHAKGTRIRKEEVARVMLDVVESGSYVRAVVHLRGNR
jgi:putative NADH-flavin reductase